MSKYKVSQQSKATVVVTLFALAFTLSSLPGIGGQKLEDGRSDLSSFVSCQIGDQIKEDGSADCNAKIKSEKDVTSKVHVELVAKTETTEGGYLITGELSVKCSVCDDGIRNSELNETVKSLSDIQPYIDKQADELANQTKSDEDKENCKVDEDGEENNRAERLQCLIAKMGDMEEKQARKFYDNKIKGELAALAESQNPQDAALAASLASQLHQQMGVNCANTVAAAQQAQMMASSNQPFNPLAAPSNTYSTTPTDYIRDSSCDILMMSNFNARMMQLGMQMNNPNKAIAMAAAQQVTGLNSQWGNYFQGRGMAINNPMMNMINNDAGTLMTQMNDFNKSFSSNYDEIVKRHSDLLSQQQAPGATVDTAGGNKDLRLLRGGAPMPENSNGGGTPAVTPFPQVNGNGNTMGLNNSGGFTMPQRNTSAPSVIAPRVDTPVGG